MQVGTEYTAQVHRTTDKLLFVLLIVNDDIYRDIIMSHVCKCNSPD